MVSKNPSEANPVDDLRNNEYLKYAIDMARSNRLTDGELCRGL